MFAGLLGKEAWIYERLKELLMPIRITRRAKGAGKRQDTEKRNLNATFGDFRMGSYTGRKEEIRILCGSI
jgi:hypothetical protein